MDRSFRLQGHRGARGLWPENTVEGFRRTITLGVRWIELDVGVLKDGTVVVHHDFALNPDLLSLGGRHPSGSLPLLRGLTWDDLEDFEMGRARPGSEVALRFPDQVALEGQRIPRLAEVLALDGGVGWTIELKLQPDRPEWTVAAEEMVERVLSEVDGAGAAGRVVVQSFDWRAPRHAGRVRPEVARAWLTRAETVADPVLWWGRDGAATVVDAVLEEGGGTWSPFYTEVTREVIGRAQSLGVAVVPWTVNEVGDMERLVDWGVDGLITDYPDRFLALRG